MAANETLILNGSKSMAEAALRRHEIAWSALLDTGELREIGKLVTATTLSWKVVDKVELFTNLRQNAAIIEQVHIGTVNERYIASATLKEPFKGLPILKILERRHASNDPTGLDSVDYLADDLDEIFGLCQAQGLPIIKEHNDMHAWLSLRFGENHEFEAKITDHLVLDVGIQELQLANQQIMERLKRPS